MIVLGYLHRTRSPAVSRSPQRVSCQAASDALAPRRSLRQSRQMSANCRPVLGSHHTPNGKVPSVAYLGEEFIPGHYCRDCGWPFTASQRRTHCQVRRACSRRQELPLEQRDYGCPYNDRVHPEWRGLHSGE
jgi:hypothetical protein